MKYAISAILLSFCLLVGCGIEEEIDKAASTCEDMVSEALEGLEEVCLTKEEILELILALQASKDVSCGGDVAP